MPVINTDEGIKAKWTTEEEDFVLIKYTLQEAAFIAERRGVKIGLEPHAQYSRHPDGLDRIYNLVKSPAIGINFDTGNAYLCGHDVYAWLERVAARLVHLHAKDISGGTLRGRARQGHRHAGGLRLRRGRARLGAHHQDRAREMPAGHRVLGRVRHAGAGGQEPGAPEQVRVTVAKSGRQHLPGACVRQNAANARPRTLASAATGELAAARRFLSLPNLNAPPPNVSLRHSGQVATQGTGQVLSESAGRCPQ